MVFLKIFNYLDDILIASSSEQKHLKRLEIVFQKLYDQEVVIIPSKCIFRQTEVIFSGHMVTKNGLKFNPQKH